MHWWTSSGKIEINRPVFIGILNLTPDSFSDGGQYLDPDAACDHAHELTREGADILDLGAESTRPGAAPIQVEEEWRRLAPILDRLKRDHPDRPLSLDTRHAETARRGLARGIAILNDVTGFSDPALLDLARGSSCGLIAMRSREKDGRLFMPDYSGPGETSSERAIAELCELKDRILAAGIHPRRVILDPGFGFGTTFQEDEAIWNALPELPERLDWPVEGFCIGVSRKRFLAWRKGQPSIPPSQRDVLTRQAHQEAKAWGYRVFRAHRVH